MITRLIPLAFEFIESLVLCIFAVVYLNFAIRRLLDMVRESAGVFAIAWRMGFIVLVWAVLVFFFLYESEELRELIF